MKLDLDYIFQKLRSLTANITTLWVGENDFRNCPYSQAKFSSFYSKQQSLNLKEVIHIVEKKIFNFFTYIPVRTVMITGQRRGPGHLLQWLCHFC
ncbi:unnamed protein product [Lactuca virosa]|uniref:Uncharacterized protein n=1 Tax=Lactuca virosa TaxID=75947 RepID=A0AAU9MMX3_9ASTR|nr:unnamed protein product [Lactuca virosa]